MCRTRSRYSMYNPCLPGTIPQQECGMRQLTIEAAELIRTFGIKFSRVSLIGQKRSLLKVAQLLLEKERVSAPRRLFTSRVVRSVVPI